MVRKSDERFVMMRSEDRSFWARSAFYLEKYKVLVWAVMFILLAVGFQFKTPAMLVNDLQSQINLNKRNVDSVVIPRMDRYEDNMNILLRLYCVDKSLTVEQKRLAGLNCSKLLGDGR